MHLSLNLHSVAHHRSPIHGVTEVRPPMCEVAWTNVTYSTYSTTGAEESCSLSEGVDTKQYSTREGECS